MFPLRTFYWGQQGARVNYSLQICNIAEEAYKNLGEKPAIVGECGIPMDMKYVICTPRYCEALTLYDANSKGEAFRTDKWHWQMRMMDAMITALDHAMVGFTYASHLLLRHMFRQHLFC